MNEDDPNNTSYSFDGSSIALSYAFRHEAKVRKFEARLDFVASIDRALENMAMCTESMDDSLQKNDDTINLANARLQHLKQLQSKAKEERNTAVKKLLDKQDICEFDDVLNAIEEEINDAEKQESMLKMGSNVLQANLDAIVRSTGEARTKITRSFFNYEDSYSTLETSMNDNCISAGLRNTDLETKLEKVLKDNEMLKEQIHSSKEELELLSVKGKDHIKIPETNTDDFTNESKLLREHKVQLLKEKADYFTNDSKLLREQVQLLKEKAEFLENKNNENYVEMKLQKMRTDNESLRQEVFFFRREHDFLEKINAQNAILEKDLDHILSVQVLDSELVHDLSEKRKNQNSFLEIEMNDILNCNKLLLQQVKCVKEDLELSNDKNEHNIVVQTELHNALNKIEQQNVNLQKELEIVLNKNKILNEQVKTQLEELRKRNIKSLGIKTKLLDILNENKIIKEHVKGSEEVFTNSQKVSSLVEENKLLKDRIKGLKDTIGKNESQTKNVHNMLDDLIDALKTKSCISVSQPKYSSDNFKQKHLEDDNTFVNDKSFGSNFNDSMSIVEQRHFEDDNTFVNEKSFGSNLNDSLSFVLEIRQDAS
eukprot:CAMPEP_0194280150 /NCGR_PEP_ID=MMETSP0169-20130528/15935_1 /TAXON_ID=218684 /ORGANISM="Corethron pennatum, Strain L29A3" /LENGTH=597 /DNA_ID=CAMNT_0039024757 /DNA_START=88 /DNA_END=1881 /DNA_ORIENTATION=+